MKNIISAITILAIFASCNSNQNSEKELELQKKELDLKQKELALKEKQLSMDSIQNAKPTGIKTASFPEQRQKEEKDELVKAIKSIKAKFVNKNEKLFLIIGEKEFLVERDFTPSDLGISNESQCKEQSCIASCGYAVGSTSREYKTTLESSGEIRVTKISLFRQMGSVYPEEEVILRISKKDY